MQISGCLYPKIKRKDIGMGEKKATGVEIARFIRRLSIQRDQRLAVIIGMGL